MSSDIADPDRGEVADDSTVCEFCGDVIERDQQDCPALHNGRCRP